MLGMFEYREPASLEEAEACILLAKTPLSLMPACLFISREAAAIPEREKASLRAALLGAKERINVALPLHHRRIDDALAVLTPSLWGDMQGRLALGAGLCFPPCHVL